MVYDITFDEAIKNTYNYLNNKKKTVLESGSTNFLLLSRFLKCLQENQTDICCLKFFASTGEQKFIDIILLFS